MSLPRLELKFEPIVKGSYITVHPVTGWSIYKEWPIERWEQLIQRIKESSLVPVWFIQIGLPTDKKIEGCDHSFMGRPLTDSINLIANAQLHMGGDSFSNHTTHMTQTPSVILWGSTQVSASGYPHNLNISLGIHCQPCFKENPSVSAQSRGPCDNLIDGVQACMAGITVDMVYDQIKDYLSSRL